MGAPQATATGTLGSTPLANLLIYALDRRLTGTLVFEDAAGRKSAILFRSGAPVKIKLGESVARLGDVIVALRLADPAAVASVEIEATAQHTLLGSMLVTRGIIDEATLSEALEEQSFRRIEWLATLGSDTVYGYYDGSDLLSAYGTPEGVDVNPLAVTWRALRLLDKAAAVDATLARIGDRELRLHPQSRTAKFGFDPREKAVVDVLRAKPQSLSKLLGTGLLPEGQIKKVVYALVVTRHLDVGTGLPIGASEQSLMPPARLQVPGPRRSGSSENPAQRSVVPSAPAPRSSDPGPLREPRPSPAPPPEARRATISESPSNPKHTTPPSASRDEPFVAEIREFATSLAEKDFYQVLGVERDAAPSVIQASFFRLAKRWHPDRLGAEYADVKDLAVRAFARMTEAHQTLSNEEQRREYDRLVKGATTSTEQEEVQRVLRAATAFQKAEVLAKRGNFAEAQKQAELAVHNDPDQAEYIALFADIVSQDPERQKTNNYADVVKMVNEARKRQPDNMKVRLYRARVLGRSGDGDGAYREFRNIVEQDAHNVEAAREVRLYEMRRGKRTTDPRKAEPKESDARRSQQRPNDRAPRGDAKGALNQDIGELFGKLFKR